MSSRVRIILSAALIALYAPYACAASPVATQLTAETMDYNMETGDFKASGNVTLRREGLTLVSVYGVANTKTQ